MLISAKSCIFASDNTAKSCIFTQNNTAKSCSAMLKRKIISELEKWRVDSFHEALLIKGARQVGKTTIIREFAKRNYRNFVEINFEMYPLAKQAFGGNLDADTIISQLSIMGFGPFVEHETLVFFDEIQSCPAARTAIKFLVEDGRFDYIESGSLLGLNYREVSSYPVGFERTINMYPLDFEEFLWAKEVSKQVIGQVVQFMQKREPLNDFMHNRMMEYFREYLIVGGMPEVVNTYINNPDFSLTLIRQRKILDSYRDDIAKYAGQNKTKAKMFFDAIPSELSKEKKRFIIADLEKKSGAGKYENAAEWLRDAGIAYFSYNTHNLLLPLEQYEKRNLYKVFLIDTGLLCAMWNDPIQWDIIQGGIDINEGALTENFVAVELVRQGYSLHYYDRKSRQELDFLISSHNKIDVIEVKSGKDYKRHVSLDILTQTEDNHIGQKMVINRFPLQNTDSVLYLPLYYTGWLNKL